MERRAYQQEALREFVESQLRLWALLWERQAGKSTEFSDFALYEMLRFRNRTVIYGSASLLLAQEITVKQTQRVDMTTREIIEKEAAQFQNFAARSAEQVTAEQVTGEQKNFQVANAETDKIVTGCSASSFAELFSMQKLEFRVYHDRTSYSRTKVIAPNIATARGWSGTILLDEIAFIRNLRELMTALLPIISTNKDFKIILSTTPPEFDDTHYSFELLAPAIGYDPKPNAAGNWYESESGIRVHRADARDTYLAGKKIFDLKTGKEITPDEAYAKAPNKAGHRIAHFLEWTLGGAAACDMQRLKSAQERGAANCQNFQIENDLDFAVAMNWLALNVHPSAKIGLGFDVATTTKGKSNPSVVSVVEEHGPECIVRARFVWKVKDPEIANERLDKIIDLIARRAGGRAKALAQDATNEKYYAEDNRKRLRKKLPVILVVASENVDKAGLDKSTNYKEYLGDQLVEKLDDNNLTLPADAYTREDYRLVMKDRGKFVCEPNDKGMHGDTFDGDKLGLYALKGSFNRTIVPPMALAQDKNPVPMQFRGASSL